ncbi:hypothetical protein [Lyngbya sp. PCC 8106]|uniref:hypothetical protein n=1 Tax=Lyngbya sp. (strain PCC 8106) TaxID=313612 RepID=UPI0000EAB250|nr:hypothetical protein [Lyngbya sp. PCC 8106]EAW39132.1 hypothetical protein L8106_04301 [Lyngbya sp. PCC 8106]
MYKVLLVDGMGTLTTTLSGQPFSQHPQDLQPLPGVSEAIAYFYRSGWIIIALVNDDQINHPSTPQSVDSAKQEKVSILRLFPAISKIYFSDWTGDFCWSVEFNFAVENKVQIIQTEYQRSDFLNLSRRDQTQFDSFRKPGAGMLRLALLELPDDLEEVWMISHYAVDREAAISAKVNFCPTTTWLKRYKEF